MKKTLMAFALLIASSPVYADPGDSIRVGTLSSKAAFVDRGTGATFRILVEADESPGGKGGTTFGIWGPGINACTTHGPGINLEFGQNPDGSFSYGGNTPLQSIQCGTAGGQSIAIEGCVAEMEAHGYLHSDHPNVIFMGTTTVDIRFQKSSSDEINITLYTPKEKINLGGKITEGNVVMRSCNK